MEPTNKQKQVLPLIKGYRIAVPPRKQSDHILLRIVNLILHNLLKKKMPLEGLGP
ncbi:hypothetical protein [Paenibacillus sp. 32O-W]|uniref:hypothetical protein n=1 Tax=Paenibacillus sp. 32O-W TaxID=1695218 RepID=UPI001C92F3F0|nr:hypothetical protein [Paenibacillus sp. 32O-W]